MLRLRFLDFFLQTGCKVAGQVFSEILVCTRRNQLDATQDEQKIHRHGNNSNTVNA